MLSYLQILILALIQGACELLPVSSSAHVIAAEKLMGLDPSSPEMTMLLVMLHTGTMFAVIVYFWSGWKRDYLSSPGQMKWFAVLIIIATFCTGVVGYGLKLVIEKIFMRGAEHAEIENLFSNLPLIAGALTAVGLLIIYAGMREDKTPRQPEIQPQHSMWIGLVQGLCLPFRGFSRSGSTISTGLILGLPKQKLEEFSFALAVVLTPPIIAKEALRLVKSHALSGQGSVAHLFVPGLVGMVLSFVAGLLALKWLSRWLEGGRWKFFGFYCLAAAVGIMLIHFKVK
ncbi:MAG TPA: undecaprenyl-diphosphate phosphatase [Candidatus Acidoferrales bacterium]|jgi:undecaprenyl-diphosphatase|nr:undecaprenyl-diphosphate phosphatase [Candidatus Acidoferrales bacterium]